MYCPDMCGTDSGCCSLDGLCSDNTQSLGVVLEYIYYTAVVYSIVALTPMSLKALGG